MLLKLTLCMTICLQLNAQMPPELPIRKLPAVTLAWGRSQDASVVSYKVYHGLQSRVYTNSYTAGDTNRYTITNINRQVTNYFAATAVNILGAESDFSDEVALPPRPFIPKTNIISISVVSGIVELGGAITWFTNTNPTDTRWFTNTNPADTRWFTNTITYTNPADTRLFKTILAPVRIECK